MKEIKYPEQFRNSNGNLFITVETPKGTYEKKLCNFTPRIAKQLIYDDGVSTTNRLVIDGIHSNGKTLPEVTIQADELAGMKWLLKFWDANCNLEIGQNTKEQVSRVHLIITTFYEAWVCSLTLSKPFVRREHYCKAFSCYETHPHSIKSTTSNVQIFVHI
ncbi:MAG: hypothetical protein R3Y35_14515 [Clostridia bacterium]